MAKRTRTQVLRSKNAGPFTLTFDIVFHSRADFELVRAKLTPGRLAQTFKVPPEEIIPVDSIEQLLALKFSVHRRRPSGHPGDSDCYGMNQEEPLRRLVDDILSDKDT